MYTFFISSQITSDSNNLLTTFKNAVWNITCIKDERNIWCMCDNFVLCEEMVWSEKG